MLVHYRSMRSIHVHALVAQRGSAKSVNKDKLLQAATRDDYHYNIISLSLWVLVYFQVFPWNYKESTNPCRSKHSIIININIIIVIVIAITTAIIVFIVIIIIISVYFQVFPRNYKESANPCCLKQSNRA